MSRRYVVWALFDSGNGCYNQVLKDSEHFEVYSIGLDLENKNDHFINLNLANYNYFGKNEIYNTLDKLPKPDVIIASPPCESWSVASSMSGGNGCWEHVKGSSFKIRDYNDYVVSNLYFDRQFIKRINGELCIFNTINIIEKYRPSVYIIENPLTSKMWEYIKRIIGFNWSCDNKVLYSNYDYPLSKPTMFVSNINLNLNYHKSGNNSIKWENYSGYNNRSNIPLKLVKDIFDKVLYYLGG